MREFKVNEYIMLKLENNESVIHVSGEKFIQCKFLLLNIPINDVESFDGIESIDEAADILGRTDEGQLGHEKISKKISVSPEEEFWAHCSNLQAWVENDYDTRLLHSNLSFPLLKKLNTLGDPLARRVFKEEIIKRLNSRSPTAVGYLIAEDYLKEFTDEELGDLIEDPSLNFLKNLLNSQIDYDQWEDHIMPDLIFDFDKRARASLVKTIRASFENEDYPLIELLVDYGILHYISDETTESILNNLRINFFQVLENTIKQVLENTIDFMDQVNDLFVSIYVKTCEQLIKLVKESCETSNEDAILFILKFSLLELLDDEKELEMFKKIGADLLNTAEKELKALLVKPSMFNARDHLGTIRYLKKAKYDRSRNELYLP